MTDDPVELEQLAIDAFNVFGTDPEKWPDVVQINRSGLVDANIRGTWTFEDRTEFFNVPFEQLELFSRDEQAIYPESSGDPD